ncbi:hypothetical protein FIBSPDRAFT_198411 [Athelia psychrophila]|uniref:Uncharacterized protein n=1 Tax=Athelia psychrophila TaxID=1759441 RepID=A0A165ZR42_9AGAM|nr:hypothetical protein FIBSPDRAFT_198411 [Fibularhizoctonia sp. CBS 109695]
MCTGIQCTLDAGMCIALLSRALKSCESVCILAIAPFSYRAPQIRGHRPDPGCSEAQARLQPSALHATLMPLGTFIICRKGPILVIYPSFVYGSLYAHAAAIDDHLMYGPERIGGWNGYAEND